MSVLIPLASALAAVAVYVLAGWRIALRRRPAFWAAARREWTIEKYINGSVRDQMIAMILFWPVVLPGRAFSARIDIAAADGDPAALARKAGERERRIAELERENDRLRRQAGGGRR